jgi:adenylate cyclase
LFSGLSGISYPPPTPKPANWCGIVDNGRVFKRTGDGVLVEFRSVVDAVRCAIEWQNSMVERNAGVAQDRRIDFRIGIHVGDVVQESDGDILGDGVNIAARLEGIARPGAICLSEQAYWQVRARLDIAVSDLGATHLKNIAEPVHAYSLQVGVAAEAKPVSQPQAGVPEMPSPRLALPSIAVLPFTNMSGDPEQEYFSDGISEDITTDLSKISGLMVISRNSCFTYKERLLVVAIAVSATLAHAEDMAESPGLSASMADEASDTREISPAIRRPSDTPPKMRS